MKPTTAAGTIERAATDGFHNVRSARPAFIHTALNTANHEIRLLRLEQELSHDRLIQCQLYHTSLPPPNSQQGKRPANEPTWPEYTALSYVWGDGNPNDEILINGESHLVRRNLFLFLRQARRRRRTRSRPIWIDAICIHQENTAEKNHQVSRMGDIYKRASEVFIWLGWWPPEQSLTYANIESKVLWRPYRIPGFRWVVPSVRRILTAFNIWPTEYIEHAPYAWKLGKWMPLCLLKLLLHIVKLDKTRDGHNLPEFFLAFACIEYWDRAWVVQECLLAKRKRVFLGTSQMTWQTFQARLSLFSADTFGMTMCSFISPDRESKCTTLADFYEKFQNQRCAELRDQLYAFAGLSTNPIPLPIDYGCTDLVAFLTSTFYICYDFCSKGEKNLDKILDFGRAVTHIIGVHINKRGGKFNMTSKRHSGPDGQVPSTKVGTPVSNLQHLEISHPYVLVGPRLCSYSSHLLRLTDTYPLSFLRWPPLHTLRYTLTSREWLITLGFQEDDVLLPCTDSAYRAYAVALVLRPVSETELVVVGRICINQYDIDWLCETWGDSGLPGVVGHRVHKEWSGEEEEDLCLWHFWHDQAVELEFASLRPFVILFGLSAGFGKLETRHNFDRGTGYREAALHLVASDAREFRYLPEMTRTGLFKDNIITFDV